MNQVKIYQNTFLINFSLINFSDHDKYNKYINDNKIEIKTVESINEIHKLRHNIFESENFRKKFENILNSPIIKFYYNVIDKYEDVIKIENDKKDNKSNNNLNTKKFLILDLIETKNFWNRIKFIPLFFKHSAITTLELQIYLNDNLPGIKIIKDWSQEIKETVKFH